MPVILAIRKSNNNTHSYTNPNNFFVTVIYIIGIRLHIKQMQQAIKKICNLNHLFNL